MLDVDTGRRIDCFSILNSGMVHSRASSAKNDSSKEFEATFTKHFGQKWPSVKKALLQPSQLVAMENMFTGHSMLGNADFVPYHHSARGADGGFPLAFRCVPTARTLKWRPVRLEPKVQIS